MIHQKWHTSILFALFFVQNVTISSTSGSSDVTEEQAKEAFGRLRTINFSPIKKCDKKSEYVDCCTKQRKELYEFLNDIRIPLSEFGSLEVYHNYYDPLVANMHCASVYHALKHLLYNKGTKKYNGGYKTYEQAKEGGWTNKLLIRVEKDIISHLRVANITPPWKDSLLGPKKYWISERKYNLSQKTVYHLMPAYASYFEQKRTLQNNEPTDTYIKRQQSPEVIAILPPQPTDPSTHTPHPFNVAGVVILGGSACVILINLLKKEKHPIKTS